VKNAGPNPSNAGKKRFGIISSAQGDVRKNECEEPGKEKRELDVNALSSGRRASDANIRYHTMDGQKNGTIRGPTSAIRDGKLSVNPNYDIKTKRPSLYPADKKH